MIIKDHDPKNTPPGCNLGGLFPSPSWNFKKENLLSVLSIYILVLGLACSFAPKSAKCQVEFNGSAFYSHWWFGSFNPYF